jgi:glycosyltransferase involved in cell wall biosynthesis
MISRQALVNVVMVTYNHENFIEEAIQSVLNQKCNFEFLLIIGDDCSSDGTTNICRDYQLKNPDKILLIRQPENVGLVLNYKSVFDACSAEYIALLEGDDYWIDNSKLQKQVDVLKANTAIGLVHTGFIVKENENLLRKPNLGIPVEKLEGLVYELILKDEISFCPLTVLFKRNLFTTFIDYQFCIDNNVWTIDAFFWPEIAKNCKVAYLPEVTGVYRRTSSAATSTTKAEKLLWYYETGLKMKLYYCKKYPIPGFDESAVKNLFLENLIRNLLLTNNFALAKFYAKNLRLHNVSSSFLFFSASYSFFRFLFKVNYDFKQQLSSIKQKFFLFRYWRAG